MVYGIVAKNIIEHFQILKKWIIFLNNFKWITNKFIIANCAILLAPGYKEVTHTWDELIGKVRSLKTYKEIII